MSKPATLTLRVLAHLLSYPDASLREHLGEMRAALRLERALGPARLAELDALMQRLAGARTMDTEADYVETFDRGRGTALHLFEHVHGDSRDRGPAMVDLVKTYEQAGLYLAPGELPDHLTVLLEYASTQPPAQAREFLREIAHILQQIFSALLRRQSPYASVLAAVLELAGERAQAVKIADEPALDESWEEPLAFDGCSTQGQARPGQPQPIQITRRAPSGAAALQPGVRT
ncbi:MAG: nitrate reductase molybdenum cofactor assembly chaperone [Burkholderiaceae bacterium]|nr:nitrate reductase molybdenum cofactor assembly chaperone [Burkholderiaceae bacterium]